MVIEDVLPTALSSFRMMLPAALRIAARPSLAQGRFVARYYYRAPLKAVHGVSTTNFWFGKQDDSDIRKITTPYRPHSPWTVERCCAASSSFRSLTRNKWGRRPRLRNSSGLKVSVDLLVEGSPSLPLEVLSQLEEAVQRDARLVVQEALKRKALTNKRYKLPGRVELSVVLCDDSHIQDLNMETRGKNAATDVLSFELEDEMDFMVQLPVKLLGDIVISLDTAKAQADERGHSLEDELRVLLVHGVTHLCGFDHEKGQEQLQIQAAEEQRIMAALGWEGTGLISMLSTTVSELSRESQGASSGPSSNGATTPAANPAPTVRPVAARYRSSDVELVALDMDGTLLDSSSHILPSSVQAIKAAIEAGVRVIVATGKARPGALSACQAAGLTGDDLLVGPSTPGIFLQGLAVHGLEGQLLSDASLPPAVVAKGFEFVRNHPSVSLCAFLGDTCATLRLTDDLQALHHVYYEPLSEVVSSLDALLAGPPVRKLLFMSRVDIINDLVKRAWTNETVGKGSSVMQAVSTMLEVVPEGVDKWAGLQRLMPHLGVDPQALMAVGDGSNDLCMIANAGLGVAMGNAGKQVKAAASVVVASNDEGGIAEAFERFVL